MSRVFAFLVAAATVGVSTLGACGSDRGEFVDNDPLPFDRNDAATSDDAQCGFRCSRDLKKALTACGDDEGQVVAQCPAGLLLDAPARRVLGRERRRCLLRDHGHEHVGHPDRDQRRMGH
mgnify:CR=1 FL=1